MSGKSADLFGSMDRIAHLLRPSRTRSTKQTLDEAIETVGHYREQSEKLAEQNRLLLGSRKAMHDKVDRLTNGLDRLVHEMHGTRTGKRDEAFARYVVI